MIKETLLAILLVIVSLTNVYTVERNDRVRADSDRNPKKSSSGYKDWYIQEFKRPAWTIEIGKTVNNKAIPKEEVLEAWEKNRMVGLWLADMVRKENIQ